MLIVFSLLGFVTGERLSYDVRYGPLRLGELELVTLAPDTVQGESCYHFRAELESSPALAFIVRARYVLESWCRKPDMVTLRSYKEIDESRYQDEWTALYDYEAGRVSYTDGEEYQLADPARDLLTLWYYFRTLNLKPGDTVRVFSHSDRRDSQVTAAVTRVVAVRTAAGEFDCSEVVPSTSGPLGTVYVSQDVDRIPVVLRTRVSGMLVSAVLREQTCEEVQ